MFQVWQMNGKIVQAAKKVLKLSGLSFASKYEAEEVWGIKLAEGIKVCY